MSALRVSMYSPRICWPRADVERARSTTHRSSHEPCRIGHLALVFVANGWATVQTFTHGLAAPKCRGLDRHGWTAGDRDAKPIAKPVLSIDLYSPPSTAKPARARSAGVSVGDTHLRFTPPTLYKDRKGWGTLIARLFRLGKSGVPARPSGARLRSAFRHTLNHYVPI